MRAPRTLLAALALFVAGCGSSTPPPSSPSNGEAAPSDAPSAAALATTSPAPGEPAPAGEPAATATGAASANALPDRTPLTGKISNAKVAELVMQNQDLFNDCYTIGAGKSHAFVATVTVKATIGPSGAVNGAEVVKSTAKNKKVDTCVLDAFKKMKFPATGSTVPITFPMEFNGAEEVK